MAIMADSKSNERGVADLRILVIGCGSIGSRHISNLCSMQAGDITAYDSDEKLLAEIKSQHKVSTSDNLDTALQNAPDVVVICSPTSTHVSLALQAAKQGCHIFIEKPLSHEMTGVAAIVKTVNKGKLVNMVACNFRFHPGPKQLKQWLDEGVIGQIISSRVHCGSYLPTWRPWQDYRKSYSASTISGGAVLDVIHEIDLTTWLLGNACRKASITLPATSIGLDTDGMSEILLEHASGAISSVHLNFIQRNYQRNILIIGTEGTLQWEFDGIDGECKRFGSDGLIVEKVAQHIGWTMNDMYVEEMQYFIECVKSGHSTFNDISCAESTIRIAVEARRIEP
jgi:predicted dehydrogenase